jgi:transcriptional regulator with XRE-family HTH domain
MTDGIYRLLRQAIDEQFEGNLTALADRLGVPVQSVSKWAYENPAKRTNPWPASCAKIAQGLGLDYDYVLELAGHRPARSAEEHAQAQVTAWRQAVHEQLERWIAAVGPQYEEFFWRNLKTYGESTVALFRDMGSAVMAPHDGAVNGAVSSAPGVTNEGEGDSGTTLERCYRAADVLLATARANLMAPSQHNRHPRSVAESPL